MKNCFLQWFFIIYPSRSAIFDCSRSRICTTLKNAKKLQISATRAKTFCTFRLLMLGCVYIVVACIFITVVILFLSLGLGLLLVFYNIFCCCCFIFYWYFFCGCGRSTRVKSSNVGDLNICATDILYGVVAELSEMPSFTRTILLLT